MCGQSTVLILWLLKDGDEIIVSPQASEIIYENDILIVIGADVDINRFEKKMLS